MENISTWITTMELNPQEIQYVTVNMNGGLYTPEYARIHHV